MERFTVTIHTGNAAFDEAPATEIARILSDLAKRLENNGLVDGPLRDINGNTVGGVVID